MPVTRIALRDQYPGNKLRIALPTKFCKELGLRAGDYVDLIQNNSDVRLRFVKVEPPTELEVATVS
jgi:hypothetical protein